LEHSVLAQTMEMIECTQGEGMQSCRRLAALNEDD